MKKTRLIQLFSIITMAAAGVFGVVSNKSAKTENRAEPVSAGTAKTVYLDFNGISDLNHCSIYMNGINTWPGVNIQNVSGYGTVTAIYSSRSTTKTFYKFNIDTSATEIALTHSTGSTWNDNKWDITDLKSSAWNLVQYTSWGNGGSYNAHHMHKIAIVDSATSTTTYEYNPAEWGNYYLPTHTNHTGYSFTGWYINGDTSGTKFNDGGAYGMPTNNINDFNFTAVYSKYKTSVTLDRQGGSGGSGSVTAVYGDDMPAITRPSRTGYTFGGYFSGTNGSGTKYYNADGSSAKKWDITDATKTIYAKWTINTYTITYDRNLNSGLQATQTKTYNNNVNAYTPGTSPLNGSGWNPSAFKRFVSWNTNYTGGGTTYLSGATISANASFYLYYIEDWYDYRYRVNGGSWVDLPHNDTDKPSGIKAQFVPTSDQSLPLNGILTFQVSTDGRSTWSDISTNNINFEGNYNTTTGITLTTVDKLYFKITDSNTYSCYVPGILDQSIAVFNSSSATTGGTPYAMRKDGDNQAVTTFDVPIEKGQFVRRGYDGNYTYGSIFKGGTGNAASCFSQVGSETAVECIKTGVYTVYNQKGDYSNWKDIWFTRNEEASAKLLAQKFNSLIESICTDIVGGTKTLSNLQAVWGSVSSTELYKHFNGQFTETMAYFKTSSSTSDAEILECVERYDYIVKKYGTTALPDFIGRNNGYQAAPQGSRALLTVSKGTNNLIAITIISVASVSTIGGYFFLRKRREN